jgi:hypothetical protein
VDETTMPISRQDDETELREIYGKMTNDILIVAGDNADVVVIMYMNVEGAWLRIFLQAGLLFVSESQPDPEDDLDEGTDYIDIGAKYALKGQFIKSACMKDGVFAIAFDSGASLTLTLKEMDGVSVLRVDDAEAG